MSKTTLSQNTNRHSNKSHDTMPDPSDITTTWDNLSPRFAKIFCVNKLSMSDYIETYTVIYDFSTATTAFHGCKRGDVKAMPEDRYTLLYERIKGFFAQYAANLRSEFKYLSDHELLQIYGNNWEKYLFRSTVINNICGYFNRYWIKTMQTQCKDFHYIYDLAILCWEENLFSYFEELITKTILNLIEKERNGEIICTSLIKDVLSSYREIGTHIEIKDTSRSIFVDIKNLGKIYQKFEQHFIESTKAYYMMDAKKFLENNSLREFLKMTDERLKQEQDRVRTYLDSQTMQPLMKAFDEVIITKNLKLFYSEFDSMLEKNQIEDLGRMYSLCKRVDGALVNLYEIMKTYIERKGQDAIAREKETIIKDPKQYVTVILNVYKQFNAIVHSAFGNDTGFVEARDKACATFINCNAVANNQNKSPELLARYCDMVMKKSSRNDSDNIDGVLDELIIILNYIEDKDVFHNIYSRFLARRFINKTSASEDCESSMLMKLKNIYGWQYTNNLQRMFNENRLNQELNDSFKKYLQDKSIQNKNPELSVMVLAQSVWPYAKTEICAVPPLLQNSFDKFTDFYFQKHQARKLTLLPNLSRGELTTTCFANRQYIFSASLPQISLILMYNDSTEYTVQAICDHLKMTPKDLISIMQPMITINLFKTNAPIDNVSPNQVVSLNLKFSSKKIRIDLLKPAQRAESSNESNNKNTNDVDVLRRHVIDATIVRIMKARKELKHQLLIGDVINQLKNRFKPQIPVIKKAIESLIEREYLQRKIDEPDVYLYLA